MARFPTMPDSLISPTILLLFLSAFASAQTGTILDHSKLPDCAFQCPNLLGAQSLCVPPTAPKADQGSYQTCFCNSNYLAVFKVGATAGVCDGTCQPAEITQIQQWFQGLCTSGVVVIPNGGDAATATTTGSSSSSTGQTGVVSTNRKVRGPTWIQQHYRWIIMVVILLLAAGGGVFLGLWLKRRSARRKEFMHRDSMLAHADTISVLRNPHPGAPSSVTQMPRFSSTGSLAASASAARIGTGGSGRMDSARGKARANSSLQEEGAGDGSPGPSNVDVESNLPVEIARRPSSKLQKSNSKRGSIK